MIKTILNHIHFTFYCLLFTVYSYSQQIIELPLSKSDKIVVKLMFRNGSICDPKGKEGLTYLTASLITEGGTQEKSSTEIKDEIYPWAAGYSSSVDKEVTIFTFEFHKDHASLFYPILKGLILTPRFAEDDFNRVKSNQQNYVEQVIRSSSDEEYSKKALEDFLFRKTNYQSMVQGTVSGVKAIALEDVISHYNTYFTRQNLLIGIAGNYTTDFFKMLLEEMKQMPQVLPVIPVSGDIPGGANVQTGNAPPAQSNVAGLEIAAGGNVSEPTTGKTASDQSSEGQKTDNQSTNPRVDENQKTDDKKIDNQRIENSKPNTRELAIRRGINVEIISKDEALGSAIFMGFPLSLTRKDDQFAALMIANSWLGEHRKSYSRLYQKIRQERSMNYGDYSYIEWYNNGGSNMLPPPGYPRSTNYFSIWIRPVQTAKGLREQYKELSGINIGHAHFAIRMAIREMDQMITNGMSAEDFELTKTFLRSYMKLYIQTPSKQLGFLMDSHFYGRKNYIAEMDALLEKVTLAEVNEAIKKYWQTQNLYISIVTDKSEAEPLAKSLKENLPSPMSYSDALKAVLTPEILKADDVVANYKLNVKNVKIVNSAETFQ